MSELSATLRANATRMPDYAKLLADAADAIWQAEQQITTLRSELAAARAELDRAREALIAAWKTIEYTDMAAGGVLPATQESRKKVRIELAMEAEARYAREIAHKGEEG